MSALLHFVVPLCFVKSLLRTVTLAGTAVDCASSHLAPTPAPTPTPTSTPTRSLSLSLTLTLTPLLDYLHASPVMWSL